MPMIKCRNCEAWKPLEKRSPTDPDKGQCFAEPPKAFPMMGQGMGGPQLAVISVRPECGPDDGCLDGEEIQEAEVQEPLKLS